MGVDVKPRLQPARIELSVVVPVYNCAECLEALHARLRESLSNLAPAAEIVFVDDRSKDDSWPQLLRLAKVDSGVKALRLSRNFGQHAAITAGLAHCSGRWVVVMDCDLQDPPELIPDLLRKAQEGYDVVLARRAYRRQSLLRQLATAAYVWSRRVLLQTHIDSDYATLSILSRKVVEAFLAIRDKDRHYMLILDWLGFERAAIEFDQPQRYAGKSSYTIRRLVQLGLDGFFFQTTTLLRWIIYLGFAIALAGAALASYYIYSYFTVNPLPGFTTLAVLILLVGGFIIISTGVTGLYIGKIFTQVKDRPLFVVDERSWEEPTRVETHAREPIESYESSAGST